MRNAVKTRTNIQVQEQKWEEEKCNCKPPVTLDSFAQRSGPCVEGKHGDCLSPPLYKDSRSGTWMGCDCGCH